MGLSCIEILMFESTQILLGLDICPKVRVWIARMGICVCMCACVFACESLLIEIYHKIITVILDIDIYIQVIGVFVSESMWVCVCLKVSFDQIRSYNYNCNFGF